METSYTINENGKREFDNKTQQNMTLEYLKQGGLYPFEYDISSKDLQVLSDKIAKNTDFKQKCAIFIYKYDIHRIVFSSLMRIIHGSLPNRWITYRTINIQELVDIYIGDERAIPLYENTDVVFVTMNIADNPHMYASYCARNLALSRKEKGKLTFFYFKGTKNDIDTLSRWKIDINGDGQKSIARIVDEEKKDVTIVDPRNLVKLSEFIQYVDLNSLNKKIKEVN